MNRVFVIEKTHLNISSLYDFGEILYVFHADEKRRPLKDEHLEDQIVSHLEKLLFDPEEDYIAIVGQQLLLTIFLTTAVCEYGSVKTLAFDATDSTYYERAMGHVGSMRKV